MQHFLAQLANIPNQRSSQLLHGNIADKFAADAVRVEVGQKGLSKQLMLDDQGHWELPFASNYTIQYPRQLKWRRNVRYAMLKLRS